jgi:hypothetical protein
MATHGVVAARSKHFFHARAGLAKAGAFQQHGADTEAPILERQQIDARDDEIAS